MDGHPETNGRGRYFFSKLFNGSSRVMEYAKLGAGRFQISRLGFGCGPASGYDYGPIDEAEWIAAVRAALERGINFFDVADVYGFGQAEAMLSRALGEKRHEVVIGTKCGLIWSESRKINRDLSSEGILRSLEGSLRRLRIDTIPLYQVHWPDPATPIEESFETLARCQEQGKIQCLGVSNFPLDLLRRAFSIHSFESDQLAYNLLCRNPEDDVFPWCQSSQVSVLAHSGLARGLLAGKRSLGVGFEFTDTRKDSPYFSDLGLSEKKKLLDAIRQLSRKIGRAFPSIAIRWVLDNPSVGAVLVGIKNRAQLQENLEALDWNLTVEDRGLLSGFSDACPAGLSGIPAHERPAARNPVTSRPIA
jgi:aryl-alcohol dehydrogenase-like predicted oxidoreductase